MEDRISANAPRLGLGHRRLNPATIFRFDLILYAISINQRKCSCIERSRATTIEPKSVMNIFLHENFIRMLILHRCSTTRSLRE